MDLMFERGDPDAPRGHALIYFRDASDAGVVAATYVILLPVTVDLQKYVPPFLAGQIPGGDEGGLSAFAFPPAPEAVESRDWVLSTADARGDDVIYGGERPLSDPMALMGAVAEIVEEYGDRYDARAGEPAPSSGPDPEAALPAAAVDDVVYAMMSEADRLTELTKLTGRLRFAIEGGDRETAADANAHMRAVALHMPGNRRIDQLIEAAADPSEDSSKVAQLLLERAYALYREDYLRVKALDEEITAASG